MNIDELTIGELRQVAKLAHAIDGTSQPQIIQQPKAKSIVRSRDQGVVYGYVLSVEGRKVVVAEARQMWKWKTPKGFVLIDVVTHGVEASECKFSGPSELPIVMLEACSIIDLTDAAQKSLDAVPNHRG